MASLDLDPDSYEDRERFNNLKKEVTTLISGHLDFSKSYKKHEKTNVVNLMKTEHYVHGALKAKWPKLNRVVVSRIIMSTLLVRSRNSSFDQLLLRDAKLTRSQYQSLLDHYPGSTRDQIVDGVNSGTMQRPLGRREAKKKGVDIWGKAISNKVLEQRRNNELEKKKAAREKKLQRQRERDAKSKKGKPVFPNNKDTTNAPPIQSSRNKPVTPAFNPDNTNTSPRVDSSHQTPTPAKKRTRDSSDTHERDDVEEGMAHLLDELKADIDYDQNSYRSDSDAQEKTPKRHRQASPISPESTKTGNSPPVNRNVHVLSSTAHLDVYIMKVGGDNYRKDDIRSGGIKVVMPKAYTSTYSDFVQFLLNVGMLLHEDDVLEFRSFKDKNNRDSQLRIISCDEHLIGMVKECTGFPERRKQWEGVCLYVSTKVWHISSSLCFVLIINRRSIGERHRG